MLPARLRLPEFQPEISAETDRKAGIVLLASVTVLLVFQYWGRPGFYNGNGPSDWVVENLGGVFAESAGGGGRLSVVGSASVIVLTLAPLAIIVWWIRRSPQEYGFRISGIARAFADVCDALPPFVADAVLGIKLDFVSGDLSFLRPRR